MLIYTGKLECEPSPLPRLFLLCRSLAREIVNKLSGHKKARDASGVRAFERLIRSQATWTGMALLVWLSSPSAPMYRTCGLKLVSSVSL